MAASTTGLLLGLLLWAALAWALPALAIEPSAGGPQSGPARYQVGFLEAYGHWYHDKTFDALEKYVQAIGMWDMLDFPANYQFDYTKITDQKSLDQAAQALMANPKLDLILAMGKGAGLALLRFNNKKTPVLVMAVPDAQHSELMISDTQCCAPNFAVYIQPHRWRTILSYFQEVVPFDKVGIMLPGKDQGPDFRSISEMVEVARELGFEVATYKDLPEDSTVDDCLRGLGVLATQGIDAVFIMPISCFDSSQNDVGPLYRYMIQHKLASFAQVGSAQVARGALAGLSSLDFARDGAFMAKMAKKLLLDYQPGKIEMIDTSQPSSALNFQTAEALGLDLSVKVIITADEIYLKTRDTAPSKKK